MWPLLRLFHHCCIVIHRRDPSHRLHPRTQTSRCPRLGTATAARFRAKMVAPYRATRVMGVADPRRKMAQSSQRPPGLTRGMQAQPGRHARLSLRISVSNSLNPSRLPSRPCALLVFFTCFQRAHSASLLFSHTPPPSLSPSPSPVFPSLTCPARHRKMQCAELRACDPLQDFYDWLDRSGNAGRKKRRDTRRPSSSIAHSLSSLVSVSPAVHPGAFAQNSEKN
jgi:hypothetical protein